MKNNDIINSNKSTERDIIRFIKLRVSSLWL